MFVAPVDHADQSLRGKIQIFYGKAGAGSLGADNIFRYLSGAVVETGQGKYTLELTRIYATDEAIRDGVKFLDLEDFSLVVCKPDRSVIYGGCQWSEVQESAEVGGNVMEKVTLEARSRVETAQ